MSATSQFTREIRSGMRASRRAGAGVPVVPLLVLIALMAAAVAYIVYVLWPRWPEPSAALDAPELPITIAGVAFEVPPAAIRMPVQRRGGAQDRIDLAFLWPSLDPAADPAKPNAPEAAPGKVLDRVFVTIAIAGDTLSPADRVKSIYPRYASMQPVAGPPGLAGTDGVGSVAFGPGGTTMAVGYDNGDVYLWDTATEKVTDILHGPAGGTGGVSAVASGPAGTLDIGAANGDVYLWHIS